MGVTNRGYEDRIPSSLPQCGDYVFHSCLKMCKIDIKHTLDATFLYLTNDLFFFDILNDFLASSCIFVQIRKYLR